MPSNRQSIVDSVVRLAIEQAESIKQLPRQIEESFSTGAPAEERAKSIGSACMEIKFELGPVTNYIERNAPHLYQKYLRRLLLILDLAEKCAAYDMPEYSKPSIRVKRASPGAQKTAELFGVTTHFADWLCQWAEELRAGPGQAHGEERSENVVSSGAEEKNAPERNPSITIQDIPQLDKENGEWVLQRKVVKLAHVKVKTLSNDRLTDALVSEDKCCGVDRRSRMWRKEKAKAQKVWYYVPSLS